jgi:trimethylamine--corrinoid protein Co-methyltransferase
MRTTQMIFGGPEQALMAVAMTQMGKYYGLPVYINVGLTDSKTVDAQAGLEVGTTLACGVLAGADIFGHLGICGVDQGTSLEMLMMQHEAIGYMERIMRGMEINDDTLALDTISSVGPGGTFISTEHTVRHFRKEIWFPEILDRNYWQTWVNKGKKELKERCYEKKEVLLKNYNPVPLARETMKEIETIIKAAERL